MQISDLEYHCSAGETFDTAARYVYGDERYAADLMNANPEFCNRFAFTGGETLRLPVVDAPTASDEAGSDIAPWRREA